MQIRTTLAAFLLFILLIPLGMHIASARTSFEVSSLSMKQFSSLTTSTRRTVVTPRSASSIQERSAQRLVNRIFRRFSIVVRDDAALRAIAQRRALLEQSIQVDFQVESLVRSAPPSTWDVSLARYPEWIVFDLRGDEPTFTVTTASIETSFAARPIPGLIEPENASVLSVQHDGQVLRSTISGTPNDGYAVDRPALAERLLAAIDAHQSTVTFPIEGKTGKIIASSDGGVQELEFLGYGQSNFKGSPYGRIMNIKKSLLERVHGWTIPAGTDASFNATLGGAISGSNGWYESLIIQNGKDLVPAPGGGICQTATTVFRAAFMTGLPILKRANHSLYVSYYRPYGVGLDATVFPGSQDLVFRNDTPGDIVVLGRINGSDAYVEFYGVPDHRAVSVDGPFFGVTEPDALQSLNVRLYANAIGWKRTVLSPLGAERSEAFVSNYTGFPRSLAASYVSDASRGMSELRGSAMP